MTLIDGDRLADSIHRALCGHITCNNCPFRTEDGGCEVEVWLDNAPVVEPKQGEWVFKEITDDYHITGLCSVCKERRRIDNFCPNCGCRMKGADDERL